MKNDELPGFKEAYAAATATRLFLPNEFTSSVYDLTVSEMRLILLGAMRMDKRKLQVMLTVNDFATAWDLTMKNAYRIFEQVAETICKRTVRVYSRGHTDFIEVPWLTKEAYFRDQKSKTCIVFEFNNELREVLTNLHERFFELTCGEMKKLSTTVDYRMYMLLKSLVYAHTLVIFKRDEFQACIGSDITDRKNFIRRHLYPGIEKINKTDLRVEHVRSTNDTIKLKISIANGEDVLTNVFSFSKTDAKRLIADTKRLKGSSDYRDYILECLNYCQEDLKQGKIKYNLNAYVKSYILQDWRPKNPKNFQRALEQGKTEEQQNQKLEDLRKADQKKQEYEELVKEIWDNLELLDKAQLKIDLKKMKFDENELMAEMLDEAMRIIDAATNQEDMISELRSHVPLIIEMTYS